MNNNSWVPIANLYLVYLYLPTKHIMESKDLLKVNFLHLILDLKNIVLIEERTLKIFC